MTKSELEILRAKYAKRDSDSISFLAASDDVNAILDALPESPRNTLLRSKYADYKSDHKVMFWIVEQDVNALLDEVVTIEPEFPQVPKVATDPEIETDAKNTV